MSEASAAQRCANVLAGQLIAQGVTDVVLCPGSRSAPLALAAHAADAAGALRLHVRIDERSAAFCALGLGKASGRAAAVVTTSGTAAGNLLPAVMEAGHAGVPLLVVTADRPAALVGFGANQTTDQVSLFGGFVAWAARVSDRAPEASWHAQAARAALLAAGAPGPVHLNVELSEPLVGGAPGPAAASAVVDGRGPEGAGAGVLTALEPGPATVVVAGDAAPALGRAWAGRAAAAGVPLVAEPSSNARRGDAALACGRLLLASPLADEIERVVVVGHPTLSRPVSRLLARPDVEVVAIAASDRWPDPGWRVTRVLRDAELPPADPAWLPRWREADAAASARVARLTAGDASGWALARAVWASCCGDTESGRTPQVLVAGASQGVRDLDLTPIAGEPPEVYANRGLAGIDGTVSTAAGVALGAGRPTTLLCGDLTFLHDSHGLALGPDEPVPDLRVVVADDSGGAIFATLEYGSPSFADAFERVFATPAGVDLAALAASYGVRASRIALADVPDALARPPRGVEVLVVPIARDTRRSVNERLAAPPDAAG